MSPSIVLGLILVYFCVLLVISFITGRKAGNAGFYLANRQAPWYVIAFGMIGASLSGVTFMSVPGWVRDTQFTYLMLVFGYLVGYFVIATVLMPMYYRLNLTSIYTYLDQRFGNASYKTGSAFFILSRTLGASLRIYLVVSVLQLFVFDVWGLPFWMSAGLFILLIILYTFQGGVKTIIWTDTLQTTFMLLAVVVTIKIVLDQLGAGLGDMMTMIAQNDLSKVIETDFHSKHYFVKQFISGAFISIVMTGLDQEMMQKNLSCRNLRDAQKNMFTFSVVLVFVNLMFLFMGAILLVYAQQKNIVLPTASDDIFPGLAMNQLGSVAGLVFLIGLISAAFPSADGALTSLTTSFTIDILNFDKSVKSEKHKIYVRKAVHLSFAFVLFALILIFHTAEDKAIVDKLFTIAGYTYGPLLGLYSFGLFTRYRVYDAAVPFIAIASPVFCYILAQYSQQWLWGYQFGFELLIVNGAFTFTGLWLARKK